MPQERIFVTTLHKSLAALLAICAGIIYLAHDLSFKPTTNQELDKVTVMITNLTGDSGGTGVIYRSSPSKSLILTNGHVCRLLQDFGGIVEGSDHKKHYVTKYRTYAKHDLCLVEVQVNYSINISIAEDSPIFGEDAVITGHPILLPTIVTRGHTSERVIFPIFDDGIIIREALVVSATIMPGSSGSGVFNKGGELIGVVFAGQGSLGYALCVPLEYIHDFLD